MTRLPEPAVSRGGTAIRIKLDTLGQLFDPPAIDPLAGRFDTRSGIEGLVRQIESNPARVGRHGSIAIEVPPELHTPDMQQRARQAIVGYCDSRLADLKHEMMLTRRSGLQSLVPALIFLGTCLSLSSAVLALPNMPQLLQRLFGEGLIIAGWVSLWRPIDILLYEWRPHRSSSRILSTLRGMPVTLHSRTSTP